MFTFKKLAPSGHFYLTTKSVDKETAEALIEANKHREKSGWYAFEIRGNEVVVGYNLWSELKFN